MPPHWFERLAVNPRYLLTAVLALASATSPSAAYTADHNVTHNAQLGTPLAAKTGRVVKISPATKYINAEHFEILTIENDKGQSFTWQFDTLIAPTGFSLRRIAPPGFQAGHALVYINHSAITFSRTDRSS